MYPPIISRSLFEKVTAIRNTRKYGKREIGLYQYTGKLYCKKCGAIYFADSGTSHTLKVSRYYKCSTLKKYHTCNAITYKKELLEDYLTSFMKEFISNDNNLEAITNVILNKNKQKKNPSIIKTSEEEKAKCE